jgi:DNA-binding response OmpR family regulator
MRNRPNNTVESKWREPNFDQDSPFSIAPLALAEKQRPASIPIRNRILIADGDALVRGSLTAALELEGFIIHEAGDGTEAVSHARQWLPDLVLLDIGLPKLEEWTKFGGKGSARRAFSVIVMTAQSHRCNSALPLHLNAFVMKPFGIPTLLQTMEKLLAESLQQRRARREGKEAGFDSKTAPAEPEAQPRAGRG